MKKIILFIFLSIQILNAQNQITFEQFGTCTLPNGWDLKLESGTTGFAIAKSNLFPSSDATCSIIYNQTSNSLGGQKKFSVLSKEFDLYSYDQYTLNFGLRFISTNAANRLNVYLIIDGIKSLAQNYSKDVVQNGLVVVNQTIPIVSNSSNKKIQIIFEYETLGIDFNSLVIIDNLFLNGPDNDDCARSVNIDLNRTCLGGNSLGAILSGPTAQCSGTFTQGLWYKYQSNFSGKLRIETKASFNDAVSVYEGSCINLKDLKCFNKDEYGFEGEVNYVDIESGKIYFIRVAKQIAFYGREDIGDLCISLTKQDPVYPTNERCESSKSVTINSNCLTETNLAAEFNNPVPSLNIKSRADVWYSFKSLAIKDLEINSHADFADVITVFKGTCNQLIEVKCEDLGGKTLLENPTLNTDYFIQVSGYFSSIEGNLCIEVKDRSTTKPQNEDCISAKAIILNQLCQKSSTINSSKSLIKPQCVVYAAPDVWYSFVAPAEKSISLDIQAGFIYHYGIYSGVCNNLKEFACGKSPDPCQGPITIIGLEAGKTYYLQILAAVNPLKPIEGDICVRIDELSKAALYNPIELNLQLDCLHGVLGKINYTVTGGQGITTYTGPSTDAILYPGSIVEAFVEDESGCRAFDKLTVDCQSPARCKNSNLDIEIVSECLFDQIGRQTGEVILHIKGKGGSGAYFLYGTADGSKLKHGDNYNIIIIDSDSCYVIEEGRINCPPFDCTQSKLKITSDYTCVDTLLKAILNVSVQGNLGIIKVTGNQNGEFLNQGDKYTIQVEDEAGCSVNLTGEIKCQFDSCAYSRPDLKVNYECIVDANGNRSGLAIMNVNATSYAGGIIYNGNKNGDTLHHLDSYLVEMVDSFGCSLSKSGQIDCLPVNSERFDRTYDVTLEPNPASEILTVHFNVPISGILNYSVFDSNGKLLENGNSTNAPKLILNVKQYPSGIIYVKFQNSTFFEIVRFVKI